MKSGTEQAKKYVDYIKQGFDYYEKYGDAAGLRMGEAAKGLQKISGKLSSGLKTAGGAFQKARDVVAWVVALKNFAGACQDMDATDRESVKLWVRDLGRFYDATGPFVKWAQSEAFKAAIAGSSVAGSVGAVIPIVTAQLYVGLKVLQAGIANVDAYFDRMERVLAESARDAASEPKPEPPAYPGDWRSREEEAEWAREREVDELERRIRAQAKRRTDDANEEFETNVFPQVYLRGRSALKDKILAAMRRAGKTAADATRGFPEADWWDCMLPGASVPHDNPLTGGPYWDDQAGIDVVPRKETVSEAEALQEIAEFRSSALRKPCPYFEELFERARKAFVQRSAGGK